MNNIWKVTEKVGSRPVLASGTIVISHGDNSATITANGFDYVFKFFPSSEKPVSSVKITSEYEIEIRLLGNIGEGCTWRWDNFGTWNDQNITLAIDAVHYPANTPGPEYFILQYTFCIGEITHIPLEDQE